MKKVMVHVPHSSLAIPPEYRPVFCVGEEEIRRQLLLMSDHYTNEFAPKDENTLVFPVSRLLCDVERFRDKDAECMTERGMWVCYTHGAQKQRIKQFALAHETEILQQFYDPHHSAFIDMARQRLEGFGECLIVDLHSFPAVPLPYEPDQTTARPDICIGTDDFHTPGPLAEYTRRFFTAAGLRVAFNTPFAGTITPLEYYGKNRRVSSIMIEINRALYLNENSFEKSQGFAKIQASLRQYIASLEKLPLI